VRQISAEEPLKYLAMDEQFTLLSAKDPPIDMIRKLVRV